MLLEGNYLHTLFGIPHRRFVSFLLICLFNDWFISHGFMAIYIYIYFILWFIIQYHFIYFVAQILPAWPLTVLLVGSWVLLTYPYHGGFSPSSSSFLIISLLPICARFSMGYLYPYYVTGVHYTLLKNSSFV